MRGKSASIVLDAYLAGIRQALACVTAAHVRGQQFAGVDVSHTLIVNGGNPVKLESRSGPLFFRVRQSYAFREHKGSGAERWQLTTLEYTYTLFDASDGNQFNPDLNPRIMAWHFHADEMGRSPTHLHVYEAITDRDNAFYESHMPTGRVSLEDVLTYLVIDLAVPPLREDWRAQLDETRQRYESERGRPGRRGAPSTEAPQD